LATSWHQQPSVVQAFSPIPRTRSRNFYQSATKNSDGNSDWFQQKPGESDVAFIKRITSSTPPPSTKPPAEAADQKGGGYQRIEDWEAQQQEARKNGTLSWEEKVQFDGQRFGNQVRQNDILMRQINSGL
jgi:hypothetical protein